MWGWDGIISAKVGPDEMGPLIIYMFSQQKSYSDHLNGKRLNNLINMVATSGFVALKRECDVCIVGAGIVGMITALLLKKQGIDVHVYDRQGAVYPLPRAVVLSDDSLRTCVAAGLGAEIHGLIKPGSSKIQEIYWRDAHKAPLARFETSKLGPSGYPRTSPFCQPIFESAVSLRCESAGIPIFRNWEVKSFEERKLQGEQEGVLVCFDSYKGKNAYNPKLEVQAKWLIGADGANSAIRKLAGIGQEDHGLCFDWLIIDTVSQQSCTW
jgi:2-polyprenyl-6-methoxyphenol hydroxylase-like FAD-dependent oxidoreductase